MTWRWLRQLQLQHLLRACFLWIGQKCPMLILVYDSLPFYCLPVSELQPVLFYILTHLRAVLQAIDGLTDDQCVHALSAIPIQQLLAHLLANQRKLAILAHHPSIQSCKELLLPVTA